MPVKSLVSLIHSQDAIQESPLVYMALNLSECASGQEHMTDGNNSFLVTSTCFYASISGSNFRIFFDLIKALATCTKTGFK